MANQINELEIALEAGYQHGQADAAAEISRLQAENAEAREIIAGLLDGSYEADREYQEALGELLKADPDAINVTHPTVVRARAFLEKSDA